MLSRLLQALAAVLVLVVAVALLRTLRQPLPPAALPAGPALVFDEAAAVQRFAASIRIRTISAPDAPPDAAAFDALQALIERSYPRLAASLQRERLGAGAELYTWAGRDAALKPALLLGHMDVVPVDEATLRQWTHPPFDGVVADGYVWGRGTLDDKSAVWSTLEAAEALLAAGYAPKRTLMFAFGDDEEVGGSDGAVRIVEQLKQRGVQAEFVLDEGGSVVRNVVPGVAGDVALIGISEKGYASVKLRVAAAGGHSSMPPRETAIGILANGLVCLERRQMPQRITPVGAQMLAALAPQQPFVQRLALSNRWLFDPLILRLTGSTPSGMASIRTTTAETIVRAGVKDNVLPTEASAVVNFRILPGDSIQDVLEHVRDTVADARIEVALLDAQGNKEPSPISATDSFGYRTLAGTIGAEFAQTTIAPYLVIGATDSAHYEPLTHDIYRYSPILYEARDLERIHGIDERLSIAGYLHAVHFMGALMRNAGQ